MTGFINVNKAAGVSSAREVAVIKKLTGCACGHMGTLDPMATGVLPVAVGNASRLFDYFLSKTKTYVAEFLFGVESDTLDTTGEMVYNGSIPERGQIASVLSEFVGEIDQIPPKYSAKCVNGQRGYRLARAGKEFSLPAKRVKIYSFKLLEGGENGRFRFEIECGGGTYIRSLARDLGSRLETCAIMSSLVRTKSGCFDIKNSVITDNLTKENIASAIIPTDSVLPFDSIQVDGAKQKKLLNGCPVEYGAADGIYKFYLSDGSFYGLSEVKQSILKVRTKLC